MGRKKNRVNRQRNNSTAMRSLALQRYLKWLGALVVLAALVALGDYLRVSFSHQPVRHVELSSDGQSVRLSELRPVVMRYVKGDFFTVNTNSMRAHLLLMPWVKSVSIRRVWPDKLTVSIHERKAVALWNETQLLSADGEEFQPPLATFPANLVHLSGPAGKEKFVLQTYETLTNEMRQYRFQIVALGLDGHSFGFRLDSGAQVYFNEGEEQQLHGFNKLYRQVLRGRMAQVERVDLRYAGGASVRWRPSTRKRLNQ